MDFDVAHALSESGSEGATEALAYAVVFGEFDGGQFLWDEMRWKQPE